MAQMCARTLVCEHMGNQYSLIDLMTFLVTLHEHQFTIHLCLCRCQPRHEFGSIVNKVLYTNKARPAARKTVVQRDRVRGQKTRAPFAGQTMNTLCRFFLCCAAFCLDRQLGKQRRTGLPELRIAYAVAGKITDLAG